MRRFVFIMSVLLVLVSFAAAADDPLKVLSESTISYFTPLTGKVTAVDGKNITASTTEKGPVRPGMRLNVLREGAPFIHPVSKEVLGNIEARVGRIEVLSADPQSFSGLVIEGEAKQGDKVRLSDTKTRVLFCQDKSVDWYLAEDLYKKLKESGRLEILDTTVDNCDEPNALATAKKLNAEVALVLTAKSDDKGTLLRERLYWVSGGSIFSDTETKLGAEYAKGLKFGEEFFAPATGEAVMRFDLPFAGRMIAAGDLDGDGKSEIIISTANTLKAYMSGVDLRPLWEKKGTSSDEFIWIDTIDMDKNGKDEVVVTSLKSSEVVSYIYELDGQELRLLWEGNYFLRKLGQGMIAQAYSVADGFSGDILEFVLEGGYKTGQVMKVPRGINIYDFVYVDGAGKEKAIFAYDDSGFLNLYDDKGIRVWRSKESAGGFARTFKKKYTVSYLDSGEWSVKDRLVQKYRETMVVQRIPMADIAKSLGAKNSRIRNFWWNGFSMEEGVMVENIAGAVLDYAFTGDTIAVLTSPFMGIKFENILRGESPLGSVLSIYSVKGR